MAVVTRNVRVSRKLETACTNCPLCEITTFRKFTAEELRFVERFKVGELRLAQGQTLLVEGDVSPHLFTVLSGWTVKHKALDDGRRQIINYALPGDLLGLQGATFDQMQHSVEALSDTVLCVFDKARLWSLYQSHPGLAFDITWIAANEKAILADYLVSIGQRTASERIAFLLLSLFRRARQVGLVRRNVVEFPFNQEHLADTIGFSLVHTNKSLGRLRKRGLFDWTGQKFTMIDEAALTDLAAHAPVDPGTRPFI